MGPLTQKWKRKFEELTLIKENLERQMNFFLSEMLSTAKVDASRREVERRRREDEKNARMDPEYPKNERLARTEQQMKKRSGRRI